MGIHLQGYINRSGRKQAWVKHWQTGIYMARQRVVLGKRGSSIGEQYPTGARQREIIQVHSNNPNKVQTKSERQGKGLIQETRAGIKHEKTSKERLTTEWAL